MQNRFCCSGYRTDCYYKHVLFSKCARANTWKIKWWTVFRGLSNEVASIKIWTGSCLKVTCIEDVHAVSLRPLKNLVEVFLVLQLYVRSCFLIDLITITSVDTPVWQLNLCMCRNVISSVLTQLRLPVMSTAPICAPVSFSSLIHSHRRGALRHWLVVEPSFFPVFLLLKSSDTN